MNEESAGVRDGIYVVVVAGGRKVFERGGPLTGDYEEGKRMVASLGGDAMAAFLAFAASGEIQKSREELEVLRSELAAARVELSRMQEGGIEESVSE